ncbi:maltase 2-like [Lycorma delicatula]|uniref:maltase 2-like n=1 Tax=Lycorma delicatula TaxID=130591 RepID=UPI003F50E1C5
MRLNNNFTNTVLTLILLIINSQLINARWKIWDKEIDWWQKSIIYQIYPLSFQDSDGDGKGDLQGIKSRLYHFTETGIDSIWLSPIFQSPKADLGYDISNFTEIDPIFGTLDDFKSLIKAVKERGMHLLMDFVPNHTSDEHPWFVKSIKKIEPYKDYYIWRDPKEVLQNGTRVPPNNWLSLFGGSGWKFVPERGQFYYHQFNAKQPDLNFYNENVKTEMKEILKFWLDLGVDGFRMDAVKHLMEDKNLHDEYCLPAYATCDDDYRKMNHNYTTDWPNTYDLIYEWREFLDNYTANSSEKQTRIMLSEAYSSIEYTMEYYGNKTRPGAQSPFNFMLLGPTVESNSSVYKYIINMWYDNMPEGHWANWVTGNHDNHRVAARVGNELVDGFYMLSMLLPGTAVTYQGEEIGQPDTPVRKDQIRDPNNNGGGAVDVRDPERGPFLWNDSENAGFTSAKIPWEPVHPSYWKINLEAQKNATKSHYKVYKQLAQLRTMPTFQRGDLDIYTITTWVLAFSRRLPGSETYLVVINVGSEREVVILGESVPKLSVKMYVAASSVNSGYEDGESIDTKLSLHATSKPLILRPKASVVLVSDYNIINPTNPPNTTNTTVAPQKNGTDHSKNYSTRNSTSLVWLLLVFSFIILCFGQNL